jgi:CheY-like chemotaxis protein
MPTVLCIDHDAGTRQSVVANLERAGYNVLSAGTVAEAHEQLDAHMRAVDLILLDIELAEPNDGIMLVRELRAQEAWRKVPIVALTAHTFSFGDSSLLATGFTAYIPKPFDQRRLIDAVQLFAPRR